MMTRFVLLLLIGLVVSLGALVSGVEPVFAKNWNATSNNKKNEKPSAAALRFTAEGVKAYEQENYEVAFKNFSAAASLNDPHAIFSLAYLYEHGLGIGKDISLAFENYSLAVDLGHKAALHNLGDLYYYGQGTNKNFTRAFQLYSESAKSELVHSLVQLSTMYYRGEGVQKNQEQAFRWAKKAAILGDKRGQSFLGWHYLKGEGVEQNFSKAFDWITKAAKQGDRVAQANLSAMFERGDGTVKNLEKARYWCEESRANGNKTKTCDHLPQIQKSATAEKEAESLRQRVAALEAEKAKQQRTISIDTKLPTITIASVNTKGKQGIVRGRVNDNTGIAEVTVDGTVVPITSNGNFEYSTFVPNGGLSLKVQATDLAGLTSMMSVTLERNAGTATAAINFDRLNPTMGKRVKVNKDALALIVGVADYENTPAKAIFADSDAMMFQDYASEKLGIPESRIKTLVNDGADEKDMLLAVKRWLARASKRDKSDVYIFFAGHGLASDDGQKMYLLPYDGAPELLDDTAILRDRLFSDIASANPRSVTVFLDTCYSGTTRGTDMLIASRPIAIKALKQSVPDNFTVMTAAAGDQTAKPLEEAKHGMFSYFLMKGMEGEADQNRDNKITAGELHSYVQQNVVQQSSGSQTPELQGDENRVLVQFQ